MYWDSVCLAVCHCSGRFHRDKTKYGSEEEGEINTVRKQKDVNAV